MTFRIYDRYEGDEEFLLYDSAQDMAVFDVSDPADVFTSLLLVLETLPEQYLFANGDNPPAIVAPGVLADGIHNLKLEVEDRAGNLSHDFLLSIEIDTETVVGSIDLIASSDTGMFDDDNVTNKMEPAFNGIAEHNAIVRVFATNVVTGQTQLVGENEVGSDLSDVVLAGETLGGQIVNGMPDDGLGLWEVTVEPLADAVYDIFAEFEDWAGNLSQTDPLRIEIDTLAPNTPLLDLVEESDSGRNDDDNITNDSTPDVTLTTHDDNLALHQLLFEDNLKYRIWDRFEGASALPEFLLYDSALDADADNVTNPGDMFTSLTLIPTKLPEQYFNLVGTNAAVLAGGVLADGIHNLKLEVEDRAGNISHDFLLDLLIDTDPYLGAGGLHPDSDSGIWGFLTTMEDRYTSDTIPAFFGTAEADNLVYVLIDGAAAGTTVAVPLDGDDAFQPPNAPFDVVEGNWQLQTNLNLADGEHVAVFTFEDPAGNRAASEPCCSSWTLRARESPM